jgi:hypothetical protein
MSYQQEQEKEKQQCDGSLMLIALNYPLPHNAQYLYSLLG